jgi:hypothetical protein
VRVVRVVRVGVDVELIGEDERVDDRRHLRVVGGRRDRRARDGARVAVVADLVERRLVEALDLVAVAHLAVAVVEPVIRFSTPSVAAASSSSSA